MNKAFYLKTFSKYFCSQTSRQERIREIISKAFNPIHFEIINESYKHAVPKDSETHFKLIIVSEIFKNKSQVANHQSIYKLLFSEMGEKKDNKLHALSLVTKTPEEWSQLNNDNLKNDSPKCMGGDDKKIK
jgi:stress-induced morphogen